MQPIISILHFGMAVRTITPVNKREIPKGGKGMPVLTTTYPDKKPDEIIMTHDGAHYALSGEDRVTYENAKSKHQREQRFDKTEAAADLRMTKNRLAAKATK